MWRCVGIDPDKSPSSWDNIQGGICLYNSADLVNCFTPECLAAAAQLTGADPSTFSKLHRHPKTYCAPDFLAAQEAKVDVFQVFQMGTALTPSISTQPWRNGRLQRLRRAGHLDHSLEEHYHKTFPPVFRIGALIYLNDIASHGGGTFVWPGISSRVRTCGAKKSSPLRIPQHTERRPDRPRSR